MSSESPVVELYSSDGYEISIQNNVSLPLGTRGLISAGYDGTTVRFILVDGSSRQIIAGAGTAGTPAAGVLSIQGVAGGTAIPVSGTVTATNASVSTTNTTQPGSATYIGGSVTTAAPTYTTATMNALSLTTAGALRIDGSTVTQPVSGTVNVNQGISNTLINAWPISITDTINGLATIKPPNISPLASDSSLVVSISPNSSVAIGGNVIIAGNNNLQNNVVFVDTNGQISVTDPNNGFLLEKLIIDQLYHNYLLDDIFSYIKNFITLATPIKPSYGISTNIVTITLTSLANGSYRQSNLVDNIFNLYQDVIITGKIKTGASGVSTNGYVTLYLVGYDGVQFSNNASGLDSGFTVDSAANLLPIWSLSCTSNATTYYFPPMYAANFAGLPWLSQKWALILFNGTGAALDATNSNFLLEWQGINLVK